MPNREAARPCRVMASLRAAAIAGLIVAVLPTLGQDGGAVRPIDCRSIPGDAERLACYDRAVGRQTPRADAPAPAAAEASGPASAGEAMVLPARVGGAGSTLADRWDLEPRADGGTGLFLPRVYKPMYLMAAMYTNEVNRTPSSPGPGTAVSSPIDLRATEMKFQISLKTKVANDLFGSSLDVWAGYTQSSRLQAFNPAISRPFRETNYEPELMVVLPTDFHVLGFHGRMASLSLNHQSNGRSLPLSRSWNRVIAQVAFEREDWLVQLRPWWRLNESAGKDNNPDISDHVGRAEVLIARRWEAHVFSLQARHSLRLGSRSRGSAEASWSFPLVGGLKGQLQFFNGYGESLIDYNVRQTRLGIGLSMIDWL